MNGAVLRVCVWMMAGKKGGGNAQPVMRAFLYVFSLHMAQYLDKHKKQRYIISSRVLRCDTRGHSHSPTFISCLILPTAW